MPPGQPGWCLMATHITGELPAAEVDAAVYTVRYWARDGRNHLFWRDEFGSPVTDVHEAQCTRGRPIPARWAFRDELSQELGEDRDHTRNCWTCFRRPR